MKLAMVFADSARLRVFTIRLFRPYHRHPVLDRVSLDRGQGGVSTPTGEIP